MPSTYDPLLRLELQATGENENTWGDKANTDFTLTAQAIAGHVSVAIGGSGDVSLTAANAAEDEARRAFLSFSGVLSGARNVIIPTAAKTYIVRNNTSGSFPLVMKTASGAAVTIQPGLNHVACDGTDCWAVVDPSKFSSGGGTISGATVVSVSSSVVSDAALTVIQSGVGPAIDSRGLVLVSVSSSVSTENAVRIRNTGNGAALSVDGRVSVSGSITVANDVNVLGVVSVPAGTINLGTTDPIVEATLGLGGNAGARVRRASGGQNAQLIAGTGGNAYLIANNDGAAIAFVDSTGQFYANKIANTLGGAAQLRTANATNLVCFEWAVAGLGGNQLYYIVDEGAVIRAIPFATNATDLSYAGGTGGPTGISLNGRAFSGDLFGIYVDALSDRRVKHNIKASDVDVLGVINAIPVVSFDLDETVGA